MYSLSDDKVWVKCKSGKYIGIPKYLYHDARGDLDFLPEYKRRIEEENLRYEEEQKRKKEEERIEAEVRRRVGSVVYHYNRLNDPIANTGPLNECYGHNSSNLCPVKRSNEQNRLNKQDRRIRSVEILSNDMTIVRDATGSELSEYCGKWDDVNKKIMKAKPDDVGITHTWITTADYNQAVSDMVNYGEPIKDPYHRMRLKRDIDRRRKYLKATAKGKLIK